MTATTQKVVADRQYETESTAYDCYISVVRIMLNTIYMSLSWVVGPKEVEDLKVLGFMLMLYTACDTLQGKSLLQHRMKPWKQINEECLKKSCRKGS